MNATKRTGWEQIVGHEWAVETFRAAIRHDRVGHAYLITGPAQIGKTTLARTFAQALNCTAPDLAERPCGVCRSCQLILAGRHPDVRLITGEVSGRGKLTIKIDQIRELQSALNLTNTEARLKVAILKQFDAANLSAANAFLKTLEEPPGHVVLLLTATDADSLLPTVTSRCQTIALRPLATSEIENALRTRWEVPESEAHFMACLADGRLGWAIEAMQDDTFLAERERALNLLDVVLKDSRVGRFALADKLAGKPEALPDILRSWLSWWRDLILVTVGQVRSTEYGEAEVITNVDRADQLQRLAFTWSRQQTLRSLKQTQEALWQLAHNANARLVVENLMLVYPFTS